MNAYFKIAGHDAIRLAERDSLQLHCYANPVDDGGPVSVGVAKQIAEEDPSLVFVKVEPDCWWDKQRVSEMPGFHVADYFAADDGTYLGPDDNGVEPTWTDAAPSTPEGP